MFCTYLHKRSSDNKVFYVGMGNPKRPNNLYQRPAHWRKVKNEHGVKVEIVASWDTLDDACSHEKLLISVFKDLGHPLINKTSGGLGNDYPKTQEHKEAHSIKMLGNSYAKGNKYSNEVKQHLSNVRKGVKKPSLMCLDCGKVCGGGSNIRQHQKHQDHVGFFEL